MTGDLADRYRTTILAMTSPVAQRYTFARYVLGESRLAAAAIAGAFKGEPMDAAEYDHVAAEWDDAARLLERVIDVLERLSRTSEEEYNVRDSEADALVEELRAYIERAALGVVGEADDE